MEEILRALFDYQKFIGNDRLEKIISDTERQCEAVVSDDELEAVSAAGEPVFPNIWEGDPDD